MEAPLQLASAQRQRPMALEIRLADRCDPRSASATPMAGAGREAGSERRFEGSLLVGFIAAA